MVYFFVRNIDKFTEYRLNQLQSEDERKRQFHKNVLSYILCLIVLVI